MSVNEDLTAYVSAFIDELTRVDVHHAVISPGSRSTPLAMLMAEHPDLNVWMNMDERSASFFALGLAKARNEPVVLVCTSGTAAANYLPAIVEANLSRVPLLVLTADRPHELRDVGAPQAINQLDLYGKNVKWFMEMALPESSLEMLRYVRTMAGRAVSTSRSGPSGPVHLNFPFREPLIPQFSSPQLWGGNRKDAKNYVSVVEGSRSLLEEEYDNIAVELKAYERGLIICGPHDEMGFADHVVQLGEKLGFPILADPLSQLRSNEHSKEMIIEGYDAFLRDDHLKSLLKPNIIIRFGAMPVSKALMLYLKKHCEVRQIIVDEDGGWREPTQLASDMIIVKASDFCKEISNRINYDERSKDWFNKWRQYNEVTKQTLTSSLEVDDLFEGKVITELLDCLPKNKESAIFIGNSMPVRDLDTFFFTDSERRIRILANRGANGIDGIVSSALGASISIEPLVLVIGDLSFFHDLNGLLAAKLHNLNITIIVVNNDGGGIFSFLPQAKEGKHFEELFGTPMGLEYSHVVQMYNGAFKQIETWEQFRESVKESIQEKGLNVIEVHTEREANVMRHREMWNEVTKNVKEISVNEKR